MSKERQTSVAHCEDHKKSHPKQGEGIATMLTQEEIDKVASHFVSPDVTLSLCCERARLAACERATARISEYLHTSLVCNTLCLAPA